MAVFLISSSIAQRTGMLAVQRYLNTGNDLFQHFFTSDSLVF